MHDLLDAVAVVARKALALWMREQTVGNLAALFLVLAAAPLLSGSGRLYVRRYATRGFRTDAIWTAFYLLGFYSFFVAGPLYRQLSALVDAHAPALRLGLLAPLGPIGQFVLLTLVMDLVGYGWHRAAHASPLLWQFHGVHHSQQQLTALTNFRFHCVDVLTRTLLQFVPGLLLGAPAAVWIPSLWIQLSLEALAHADLGWTYGPLGKLIVSPAFHRVHHSVEPRHYGRNFGLSYSLWDHLFGTAALDESRPRAYGNPEVHLPESFLRQLLLPFAAVFRRGNGRGARRAA